MPARGASGVAIRRGLWRTDFLLALNQMWLTRRYQEPFGKHGDLQCACISCFYPVPVAALDRLRSAHQAIRGRRRGTTVWSS